MFKLYFPARQVIRENCNWILMALAIFMVSALYVYYNTVITTGGAEESLGGPLEQLQNLLFNLLKMQPAVVITIIFLNNFLTMAQMLILGVLAGISPLFTLGANGALVGFLASASSQQGVPLLPMIVLGILPHGLFELFAFFLCGALGLKFGYHCIASPLPGKTRMESFKHIWKETISVLPLITLLLIIAAVIEVLVTPNLLTHLI